MRAGADGWEMAVIEPQAEAAAARKAGKTRSKTVLALPKGLVDPGEKAQETAVREVYEETGVRGEVVTKLTDIKYVYVRTWGDGQRVFKIVSFYLLRYLSGEIDNVSQEMRVEVKRALWIPLDGADAKVTYRGEKDVVRLAQKYLQAHAAEAS